MSYYGALADILAYADDMDEVIAESPEAEDETEAAFDAGYQQALEDLRQEVYKYMQFGRDED